MGCSACGSERTSAVVVAEYVKRIRGVVVTIPDAQLIRCRACGEEYVTLPELQRWEKFVRAAQDAIASNP